VESAHDTGTREVLACDESFFAALLAADHDLLGTILADDFVIIDVLSGQVARREELLGAIGSGQLRFTEVTRYAEERSVRLRESVAVVAGRTQMVLRYQGNEVTAPSRYTHVYTRDSGRWRLLSAQGTPTRAPRMSAGRVPLFCDTALAGRIERVEVQLIAQCNEAARRRAGTAGFVIPVAGGVASFAGEGSPYNKVAGLGFGGLPDSAALDEIEKAFADCGSPVQIELAHLAGPAIGALLAGRGYRLESFENVLGRALAGEPVHAQVSAQRQDGQQLGETDAFGGRRGVRHASIIAGGARQRTPPHRRSGVSDRAGPVPGNGTATRYVVAGTMRSSTARAPATGRAPQPGFSVDRRPELVIQLAGGVPCSM
jgi:ketosteroid isomerase-like protein